MKLEFLDTPLELKVLNDAGEFEGYAAVFGNVDDGGDVIEPGAFKEFQRTLDGKILVLNQHNLAEPIGKADVIQDGRGLLTKGKLVLDDPIARRVHAHMKAGTLDAMSVGYRTLPGGAETKGRTRHLKALKLFETSILPFGMNSLARISAVKAAESIATIREFEDFLRDEGKFSNTEAKLIASGGWKALNSARDESEGKRAVEQLVAGFGDLPLFKLP